MIALVGPPACVNLVGPVLPERDNAAGIEKTRDPGGVRHRYRSFFASRSCWQFRVDRMDRGSSFPVELPPVVIGVSNVQSGPSEFLGQKKLQESTSTASVEVLREGKDWKRSAVHRGGPAAQATLRQIRV